MDVEGVEEAPSVYDSKAGTTKHYTVEPDESALITLRCVDEGNVVTEFKVNARSHARTPPSL